MSKSTKHFLSKAEIHSFKGLRDTTLDDLGRINLILGDNNVGKTSVLEALIIDENPYKTLANLRGIYFSKMNMHGIVENIDFITPFLDYAAKEQKIQIGAYFAGSTKVKNFAITTKEVGALSKTQAGKLDFKSSDNFQAAIINIGTSEHVISQDSPGLSTADLVYMPFISTKILYSNDLLEFYSKSIIPSKLKKRSLIKSMELFVPGLEDIEISTQAGSNIPLLITRIKDIDSILPLNMYGDGSIKFFRILVEIAVSAESRLMIDEIDSGIHFSRLKSLWRTTISSAVQNNTQLFITTHNEECLAYLKEVLEEEHFIDIQNECRCYTLKKLPDGSTKAFKYEFENFAFAINQQIELRGGVL